MRSRHGQDMRDLIGKFGWLFHLFLHVHIFRMNVFTCRAVRRRTVASLPHWAVSGTGGVTLSKCCTPCFVPQYVEKSYPGVFVYVTARGRVKNFVIIQPLNEKICILRYTRNLRQLLYVLVVQYLKCV